MKMTHELIFIFVVLQLTWFAYVHIRIGGKVDDLERSLRERRYDDEKTQKYGFLLRKISTLERTVYKFDFDLDRVSNEVNTIAKLASSNRNGVDTREIVKIKKRLDVLQEILNHVPDLVEKVEDENKDSFTALKEELNSLRVSVMGQQRSNNGGGVILDREVVNRPGDAPQSRRSHLPSPSSVDNENK